MCGLCSLSLQSCHRPGGDGFRPEQTKNDPTCCLQGACQGDSTCLLEFLEMERRVQTCDCAQMSAAETEQPCYHFKPFFCVFLCCDSCIYCIHMCVSAGRPWCEGLDPHQRQKQRYHVCWLAGQWQNHNLLQGGVTRPHIQ